MTFQNRPYRAAHPRMAICGSAPPRVHNTAVLLQSKEGSVSCTDPSLWTPVCQKQVSRVWISNYIPQYTVGCNYLAMPLIPAYGTEDLIYNFWKHFTEPSQSTEHHIRSSEEIWESYWFRPMRIVVSAMEERGLSLHIVEKIDSITNCNEFKISISHVQRQYN